VIDKPYLFKNIRKSRRMREQREKYSSNVQIIFKQTETLDDEGRQR